MNDTRRGPALEQPRIALAAITSLVVLLALLSSAASSAFAGVYDVRACDAADGVNNSWGANTNASWMTAYAQCPTGGNQDAGLVARSSMPAQVAGTSQGVVAQMVFTAPPGAAVVGLRASYRFSRTDATWEAALSNGQQVLRGCPSGGGNVCEFSRSDEDFGIPPSRVIYIDAFCAFGSCPFGGGAGASARLYSAIVHVSDDSPPGLGSAGGSLWADGWRGGTQTVSFDASDNVGIRETRVYIDGNPVQQAAKACDYTLPAPCPQGGGVFSFDTRAAGTDGSHTLTLQAIDTAGNTGQASRRVQLDNTAPNPPEKLAVDGGDGWHSANAFTVRWQNPADPGSPIAGALYELCPNGGGKCIQGSRDGKSITAIEGVKVPAAGDYQLRLWLRDEAGNGDRRNAGEAVHLRFDDQAPTPSFLAQDPEDPTRLGVRVEDDVSGLGTGSIEVKRRRGTTWRPLATRVEGSTLVATVDDEHLRNGLYDLRARALDRAGNERSTTERADGAAATIMLPVRVRTVLRAGVARRVRHGRRARQARLRRRVSVPFGRPVRIRGRLTAADGTPVAETDVLVLQRVHAAGAAWTSVATLKTSRTGRFSYLARKGVSRVIRFRYGGAAVIRPANRDVAVRVLARSTFHVNRRSFVNGQSATFSGGVRGGHVPEGGKLVELQAYVRGRFRTFATTRTNARGRWRYEYRFDGTRGRVRYRFRVRVPREATYPFETGASPHKRVLVRGV